MGVQGGLSNDVANSSVDLVVTRVTVPRWSGALNAVWSTSTLAAPKNWVLNSDGVTPLDYVDGEAVRFDDSAVHPTVSISVTNVSPASVTISNTAESYSISGSFGIVGPAGLVKQGGGPLLLGTTNTYTGDTLIASGTLSLGAAGAVPSGAGAGQVTVNGTLDVAGPSATINNLSGSGVVDDLTAGGAPVLDVQNTTDSTFSGVIQNSSGVLGLTLTGGGSLTLSGASTCTGPITVSNGTLVVNGSLGAGGLTVWAVARWPAPEP